MSSEHRIKFTYEDYLLFPEAEARKRHEIIDGDHYVLLSPSTHHQRISGNLAVALHHFLNQSEGGEIFTAPLDVILSQTDIVQPDLLFISSGRASIITDKNIQGPPDLVVEILSEATRKTDEVIKRKLYERYGVLEYWIVDPELETVKVYQKTEKGYARAEELSREVNDTLTTPLLSGFQILLNEIFA